MRIGFMQGRLCAQVNGKIQAFPWDEWELEFPRAQALGIDLMEWTLDQERLGENPLLTPQGRARIAALRAQHGVEVLSLTGDCFMQAPFYKSSGTERAALLNDLHAIVDACDQARIQHILIPLVDNGALTNEREAAALLEGLQPLTPRLRTRGQTIVFESDFAPQELKDFIARLPADVFGINYDIGNSAALGYDPTAEIEAYGDRILNVHIKDRVRGGTTVPLGTGNADFDAVFAALARCAYRGNFILQTARAADDDHAGALARYRDLARTVGQRHGFSAS